MIIGANCSKGLEPFQVIRSQHEGPYAFLTKPGWSIVGPNGCSRHPNSLSCHRISVSEANQVIVNRNQLSETSIKGMLKKLYEIEHVNLLPGNCPEKISQEDIRIFSIIN